MTYEQLALSAVDDLSDLPANALTGDVRYVCSQNKVYCHNGLGWVALKVMDIAPPPWNLFLDDLRKPSDVQLLSAVDVYTVAVSTEAAKALVLKRGLPKIMSLDHDLGGDDTSFKFLWWLINGHLDEDWDLRTVEHIQVHTANPVGASKLIALWENFCRVQQIYTPMIRVWPKATPA